MWGGGEEKEKGAVSTFPKREKAKNVGADFDDDQVDTAY